MNLLSNLRSIIAPPKVQPSAAKILDSVGLDTALKPKKKKAQPRTITQQQQPVLSTTLGE